jgi:glycosyltransferase involved in cell wall biosynthesis
MHPLPSVLVVTPTLGESPLLEQTVASVAAQPLPITHVLAAPLRRVEALQLRYPHTLVVPDAGRGGGVYGALNAALAQAPAGWEWFTYINDDDLLLPGFGLVARAHLLLSDPEPVTYGNVEQIDESGRRVGEVTVARNPDWIPALLQQGISPLMQQGMLFHRECVTRRQGFDTRYRLCADLDFWLRACAAGERFRYYAVPVAQFRLRAGQLSGNTALTEQEQTHIVRRHFPARLPAWRRHLASLRYRLHNLPRYLERLRLHGPRTSYRMLQHSH